MGSQEKIAHAYDESLPNLLIHLQACLLGVGSPGIAVKPTTAVGDKRSGGEVRVLSGAGTCAEVGRRLASQEQGCGGLRRRGHYRSVRIGKRLPTVAGVGRIETELIEHPRGG